MRIATPASRPLVAALAATACVASVLVPATADAAGSAAGNTPAASTPHRAVAPRATAAGKLAASGCTETGATATCDLYAMAGETSLLGATVPIWGFSGTGDPGSATAPGPVLVVHQGDTVTLTLHNQLNGQQVSLALPGQSRVSWGGAPGDDTAGVAAGDTRSYTFTADRPGTFLYEAGHTANGGRQVAMGLAGALVVLAGDGSAYGARAGYPDTTYDDDAVLVLSEIDPDLNNNPATFDMRSFAPKYRLINGRPYPSTDPVNTDQGHTVLLRYVNVGAQTHAMTVLGADQVEVAQDGHPMKFPTTLAAESIEPGESRDMLVKVPTGPEAKLPLFEPAQHLDNNGMNNGDPQQLAFGGMLTFIDTNAPAPTEDKIGPTGGNVTLSPNPSDGTSEVTVTADFDDKSTGGSIVDGAEFVIDDPTTTAPGGGTAMTGDFTSVSVTGATGTITTAMLDALDAGKHTVYVRAHDLSGNWGAVASAVLTLPKTGPQTTGGYADTPANGQSDLAISATGDDSLAGGKIDKAEYAVDAKPAGGSGTPMTLNRSAKIVSEDATLPAADVLALGEGVHDVYVHSHDTLGLWGPWLDIPLTVDLTGPSVDAASAGPNPTNGVLSDLANPGNLLVSAQITDRDAGGAAQSTLVDAEGFLNPKGNPAGGSGFQLIAVDGRMDSQTEAVYGLIPISQIRTLTDGTYPVSVRGKDAAGNWGPLFQVNLVVDRTAPVLGALSAAVASATTGGWTLTAPVTDTSLVAHAEYWVGTADPGAGRATTTSVSTVDGKAVVTVAVPTVGTGTRRINLRVQDLAGNWSKAANVVVKLQKTSAIFLDTFDSGNLAAWAATTGPVSVTTAAGIPSDGTNRGLQVTVPASDDTRIGYVTDTSPAAETEYHARFAFHPNTLAPGATVTIFKAASDKNAAVFTVQGRKQGSAWQIRTTLVGASGTTQGPWVNLTAGAHTIAVDWVAATQGGVSLAVDGSLATSQLADTGTRRVGTAMLGLVAGSTAKTKGVAFFDSFVSTRAVTP